MAEHPLDTDLVTMIDYPQGASGKFLSCCLCFSDAFHPQAPSFIPDGAQRRSYMLSELEAWAARRSQGEVIWDDMRMGDACFFGVPNHNEDAGSMADVPSHRDQLMSAPGVHHACVSNGLGFFRNVHNGDAARFYADVWPNARRISMVNCAAWITLRNQHGLSLQMFRARDRAQDMDPHDGYTWDCEDFSSWDRFLLAYTRLLSWYGLGPRHLAELRDFYRLYLHTNVPLLSHAPSLSARQTGSTYAP